MIPPKSNRKVQRDFDKDAYKARLCKSWTATLARDVQETTVFIRAQARKKLSTTTSATATDKNSHDLFAHGLRLAVDCAQPDREAERAWAAQTTVPPGFDAVPRPPGASSPASNPNPLQLAPPASQPKISDRLGQPPAQSDTAQPNARPGPVADITPLMHGLH